MKRTSAFLLLTATLLLIEVPMETQAAARKPTESLSIGRKRKGYKAKRGGLFNTGLFRKKNPCGCPNH